MFLKRIIKMKKLKFNKKILYIVLFTILYCIVAFSSLYHAVAFFGLANNMWMSVILAFAFEIGQAAVLLSLLTSKKDRSRIMPWVLMSMFTLVQVIGNVFSSYKYLVTHSSENLKFFKEPIFIWTDIPDNVANVIITYIVGAILPITALLLTGMVTNYLNDTNDSESSNEIIKKDEDVVEEPKVIEEPKEKPKEEPKVVEEVKIEEPKIVEEPKVVEESKVVEEPKEKPKVIEEKDTVKNNIYDNVNTEHNIVEEPVKEHIITNESDIIKDKTNRIKSRFLN